MAAFGLALAMLMGGVALGRWASERFAATGPDVVHNVKIASQKEALQGQIEVFRLVNGRLPPSLREAGAALATRINFSYSANDSAGTYVLEVRK